MISLIFMVPISRRLAKKQADVNLEIQNIHERKNLIQAAMRQEKQAIVSFRGKIVKASQLKGMIERLATSLKLEETSKLITSEVNKLFGDRDTIIILYLFHSRTGELGLSSSQKGQMRVNIKMKKGDIFDQWTVKKMQPLLVLDARSDYRFDIDKVHPQDARTVRSLISLFHG